MTGDSFARTGSATGAGDDRISAGLGAEGAFGDSNGCWLVAAGCTVSGDGGDDVIDRGPDGGLFAAGDHNTDQPGVSVTGAGNDEVTGGTRSEFLIGDSFADIPSEAGDDRIEGGGGNDSIFGDNTDFFGNGSILTVGGRTSWTETRGTTSCAAARLMMSSTAGLTSTTAPARAATTPSKTARAARDADAASAQGHLGQRSFGLAQPSARVRVVVWPLSLDGSHSPCSPARPRWTKERAGGRQTGAAPAFAWWRPRRSHRPGAATASKQHRRCVS